MLILLVLLPTKRKFYQVMLSALLRSFGHIARIILLVLAYWNKETINGLQTSKVGQICKCPWHGTGSNQRCCHVFCVIEPDFSVVKVISYLDQQVDTCSFVVFHVCENLQIDLVGEQFCPLIHALRKGHLSEPS